jgi:hypothetical protein
MRFQILLLGTILCLGAAAQGQTTNPNTKSTQSANRMKQPASTEAQSVTGCVDEQNGHYVLRDVQTSQLITLQSAGTDADNDFARFVGHQAQASGTISSSTLTVTHIGQVADMCPAGK